MRAMRAAPRGERAAPFVPRRPLCFRSEWGRALVAVRALCGVLSLLLLLLLIGERGSRREGETTICCPTYYAFIRLIPVNSKDLDDALTNWATWPGPVTDFFFF